jgi:hypothetical protein
MWYQGILAARTAMNRYLVRWGVLLAIIVPFSVWVALGPIQNSLRPSARQEVQNAFREAPAPRSAQEAEERRLIEQAAVEQVEASRSHFSHRIDFHGIVRDEAGNPIPGANVTYQVASSLLEVIMSIDHPQKPSIGPRTGADGRFSITGKRGADIWVTVSHPDYYSEKNRADLDYNHLSPDARPTREKPVEFILRRKGVTEPLLSMSRTVDVPKDGTPIDLGMSSEQAKDIVVQVWTDPGPAPYAWRMRIEVPGGGLVRREDRYQFLAPETGYAPSFEFSMPIEGIEGQWNGDHDVTFFVRLAGSRYARFRFDLTTRGDHFALVQSLYNPSGSRNLEFDPEKQIRP